MLLLCIYVLLFFLLQVVDGRKLSTYRHHLQQNSTTACYQKTTLELSGIIRLHRSHHSNQGNIQNTWRPLNTQCDTIRVTAPQNIWPFLQNISERDLPWRCQKTSKTLRIALGLFPRHVPIVQCTHCNCMFGRFQCVPVMRPIQLLILNSCQAVQKPGHANLLQEEWTFEELSVPVGCECARRVEKKK